MYYPAKIIQIPDGSTLAPLPSGTQPQSSDCGCNHHTPHNTSGTPATNKPCIATSSSKAVTDTTQSTGTVSKDQNCPEPQSEDQGYFYVTDKEGTDTHHAARTFFNILNKGCGDLFDLNSRTGLVKLKPGKKQEDINKLVTSSIPPLLVLFSDQQPRAGHAYTEFRPIWSRHLASSSLTVSVPLT